MSKKFFITILLSLFIGIFWYQQQGSEKPATSVVKITNASGLANPNGYASRAPASRHCEMGSQFFDHHPDGRPILDENGKPKTLECPENCTKFTDYPGYTETFKKFRADLAAGLNPDPPSFQTDQDTLPTCAGHPVIQFIGIQSNSLGTDLGKDIPKYGISELDLELQAYKFQKLGNRKIMPDKEELTIKHFLGPGVDKNGNLETWSNGIPRDARDLLYVAKQYGVCPESAFPSEFLGNYLGRRANIRSMYEALENQINRVKTEANATMEGFCPECRSVMAPSLTTDQWKQITKKIKNNKDMTSLDVIIEINDLACAGKRVKISQSVNLSIDKSYGLKEVMNQMNKPLTPAILNIDPRKLDPTIKTDGRSKHSVLLYSTNLRKITHKDGTQSLVCYYMIKNSWGQDACKSDPNNDDLICDVHGNYLVPEHVLKKMLVGAEIYL